MGKLRPQSLLLAVLCTLPALAASPDGKVPITTSSEKARALFLEGRALTEALRGTDAHKKFEEAIAADPNFAIAYLFAANTSGTTKEFFAELRKAVALKDKVSDGERLAIEAAQAGATSEPDKQAAAMTRITELYPQDDRALANLGNFYFGQQDWTNTITYLKRATEVNPGFSLPYNQLGYAYRFQGRYTEAEDTFKKYTQLVPSDPNPYDSYAELLMKMGRFEDSIANYKKALAIDPHFVSAYIGIGHDQILLGKGDDARATLSELSGKVARTDGEKRAALFWRAVSYLHEGRYTEALAEAKKEEDIAKAGKDLLSQSQDQTFMGNIALRAGKADEALEHFAQSAKISAKANVPAEVKEAASRNALFNTGRAALMKGDLKTAEAQAQDYAARVRKNNVRFEVWASHELLGMIALAKKNYGGALGELAQANQRDPRVTYLTAVALEGKGDMPAALDLAKKAAEYNEITNPNFAYIRSDAQKLAAKLHG